MKGYKMEPYLFDEKECCGTKFSLETFIQYCEDDDITDDDGVAGEIILNGYVVSEIEFYPSAALDQKEEMFALQKEKGKIEIVWYNK